MKKYYILLLACIWMMCMLGCGTRNTSASGGSEGAASQNGGQEVPEGEEPSSFLAKVISADEQMLLVEPLYGERELRSADRIEVGIQNILSEEERSSLNEGDIVQIIYDGYLLETYPAQTQKVYDVTLKELSEIFAICYSSWYIAEQKNIYDTVAGYIQKDLITEGIATVDYTPDDETLVAVWNKVSELDLLSIDRMMISTVLADSDEVFEMEPCMQYEIIIQINGTEYTIKGDETAWYYRGTDEQADSFSAFVSFMNQLMKNTAEYQSLPEAVGGYD